METACTHDTCTLDESFVWHCDACGGRVDARLIDERREAAWRETRSITRHFDSLR